MNVVVVGFLTWTAAAAQAAAPAERVTYRNGTLVAADAGHRLLIVDLGDGVVHLRAGAGVNLATLRAGEPVLVGIGEDASGSRAVYVRGSATSSASADGGAPLSAGAALGPGSPRRPLHVIPNHDGPRRPAADADADELPLGTGKTAASMIVAEAPIVPPPAETAAPETAPSAPTALELAREDGRRQVAAALDSMDVLVREVDRAWTSYVHACPAAGDSRPRGWLALPADAVAPAGTCSDLLASVRRSSSAVRQRLAEIEDAARAASVTPGTLRELLDRYELGR